MYEPIPRIYLISDRRLAKDEQDFLDRIEGALAAGIRLFQLREKDLSTVELFQLGQKLRKLTRHYDAALLINDRIDLALALDADGVHLTENSLPTAVARHLLGAEKMIGVSTHQAETINRHAAAGADFVTFSPVYAPLSKAAFGPPQGIAVLGKACLKAEIPVFALGGINPQRASECRQAGAYGVAVISAILDSKDPFNSATEFIQLI